MIEAEHITLQRVFALPRSRPRHAVRRRALFVLSVAGLLLGLALLLYPFWPRLQYAVSRPNAASAHSVTIGKERSLVAADRVITENRLFIPKIGVDIAVLEGDATVLDKGAWRLPNTSPDPLVGNMALSAHRYQFLPPASETFYLLDKVERDDVIVLRWQGKEYQYRVTGSRVVQPDDVSVLAQTEQPQLTLITCTPLFSTARRLVVTAELMEQAR